MGNPWYSSLLINVISIAFLVLKTCLAEVFVDDIENYENGQRSFVQMIDYKTGTARDKQLNAQDDIITHKVG